MFRRSRYDVLVATVRRRDRLAFRLLATSLGSVGAGTTVAMPFYVNGPGGVHLGSDVHLGHRCGLSTFDGGRVIIGNGCRFTDDVHVTAITTIELEPHVLVGPGVRLIDHRHLFDDATRPIMDQGLGGGAPILVREGAWLATGAVVLAGVTIGRNAVVGALAVVTSDVPDHAIAVGAPAHVVGDTRDRADPVHAAG